MKPVIGLTAMYSDANGAQVYKANYTYVQAILRAGGVPVLLPAVTDIDDYVDLAEQLDGLLVPGGPDVSPLYYNEEPIQQVKTVCSADDAFEMAIIRKMAEQNKPILGICRGHQVINVTFGGSLYQDLPAQYPNSNCHQQASRRNEPFHHVELVPGSHIAEIFGQNALVTNTFHHQAVKEPAPGFKVVGHARDGVVEAIEHESKFIIGLQWHPEGMAPDNPLFQKVFDALVAEAGK